MTKKIILTSLVSLIASTALVAWSFTEPAGNISQVTLTAPLNIGRATQFKVSGLAVNLGRADIGLTVQGNSNKGFVGIAIQDPIEKLHLLGNLFITGAIKPNGTSGSNGQVLAIDGFGKSLEWADKYAWLSLTSGAEKTPLCGNGNIDPGETCSNCPDAACGSGLICWQGQCVNPGGGGSQQCGNFICEFNESCSTCAADCGKCPSGCGDGDLNLQTEQCEPSSIYSCPFVQIDISCGNHTHTRWRPQVCAGCQCVNTYIPPFPDGPCLPDDPDDPPPPGFPWNPPLPPGGGGGSGGGGCGITGGPWTGGPDVPAYTCGGDCPKTANGTPQTCEYNGTWKKYGQPACRCTPVFGPPPPEPPSQGGSQQEVIKPLEPSSEFLAKVSGVPGIRIAEGAGSCTANLQPPQCPSEWTQADSPFGLLCAELNDGSSTWVRNCYKVK